MHSQNRQSPRQFFSGYQQMKDYENNLNQSIFEQNPQQFFRTILQVIAEINKLRIPLKFQKVGSQKTTQIVSGTVGSGKSCLLNNFIKHIQPQQNFNEWFKSGRSSTSITKEVSSKLIGNARLIDVPGTNDSDKEFTDQIISRKFFDFLEEFIFTEGISSITQCIMISSGRICKEEIKAMSTLLLALTIVYPDFDIKYAPRISVIFNNFTKNSTDSEIDDENSMEIEDSLTIQQLISDFKKNLSNQVHLDMQEKMDKRQIVKRIEKIFPDQNFYAYIYNKKQQQIDEEVQRLFQDNLNHGRYQIINQAESQLCSVQLDHEMRNTIQQHIDQMIAICIESLRQFNESYRQSQNKYSDKISGYLENFILIQEKFSKLSIQYPWCLMKANPIVVNLFKNSIEKVTLFSSKLAYLEISDENESLKKNIDQLQKVKQDFEDKYQNQIKKNQVLQNKYENELQEQEQIFQEKENKLLLQREQLTRTIEQGIEQQEQQQKELEHVQQQFQQMEFKNQQEKEAHLQQMERMEQSLKQQQQFINQQSQQMQQLSAQLADARNKGGFLGKILCVIASIFTRNPLPFIRGDG